jgi:hypothetical protein
MWKRAKEKEKERITEILNASLGTLPKDLPQLICDIRELVGPKEEIPKLKKELAELKLKKEMEERDIKHLVKLKEEKLDIEHKKKELDLKDKFKDKEMKLQTDYHDKVVGQIDSFRAEMKEVYTEIMKRLPNVNMEMEVSRKK